MRRSRELTTPQKVLRVVTGVAIALIALAASALLPKSEKEAATGLLILLISLIVTLITTVSTKRPIRFVAGGYAATLGAVLLFMMLLLGPG